MDTQVDLAELRRERVARRGRGERRVIGHAMRELNEPIAPFARPQYDGREPDRLARTHDPSVSARPANDNNIRPRLWGSVAYDHGNDAAGRILFEAANRNHRQGSRPGWDAQHADEVHCW